MRTPKDTKICWKIMLTCTSGEKCNLHTHHPPFRSHLSANRQNTLKLFWKPTQDTKILGERDQTMPTFQQFYSVCLLRMSLFCCCPHTGTSEAWEGSETIHIMGNIKRRKKEHLFAMETLEVRPLLKDDVHRSLFIYRKIIMIFN